MGITGLIPFLEKASSKIHLKDIKGSTVAVDTYCWLHKGTFACADKLARGEDCDAYITYCLRYVQLLRSHHIRPILVFDGRHLPAKALTEERRRESRQQAKKRAAELLRLGRNDEAHKQLRRCVDVTHAMALRLIRECRKENVDCIVAPYEADAQMAWLNKVKLAQYVITEDSDLVLFGTTKVIFKLDMSGNALLVQADRLHLAMGCPATKYSFEKFRRMCILSGCDYLDSLPGIGLGKACKFFLTTEETNMWRGLKKIPQYLNMRSLEVDDDYIENFLKAEATFKHMYIYNPYERRMERLHELAEFETNEKYCVNAGEIIPAEQAFQLALGNLNPFDLRPMDNWHPDLVDVEQKRESFFKRTTSIWHRTTHQTKALDVPDIAKSPPASKIRSFYARDIDKTKPKSIKDEQHIIEDLYTKKETKIHHEEHDTHDVDSNNDEKGLLDKLEVTQHDNDPVVLKRPSIGKDNTKIVVKSRFFTTSHCTEQLVAMPISNDSSLIIKPRLQQLSTFKAQDLTAVEKCNLPSAPIETDIKPSNVVQVKALKMLSPAKSRKRSRSSCPPDSADLLVNSKKQSLLSKFGFQKRSSIK